MITIRKDGSMTRMPGDKSSPFDDWELLYNKAAKERDELRRQRDQLLRAAKGTLPLAEAFLQGAPSHPDNAKLEDLRAAIAAVETSKQQATD